jgi:transcriptional regulator with XRE-family HTH domain
VSSVREGSLELGGEGGNLVDGAALARFRKDRGWTQEVLAERAGLSTVIVRKLEQKARRSARISTLSALAKALSVQVAALLPESRVAEPIQVSAWPERIEGEARQLQSTLLRVLAAERRWQRFRTFETQFRRAARELAEQEQEPDLAKLTVSPRQWERWYTGEVKTEPHADACRVLEHMFGYPVRVLLAPSDAEAERNRAASNSDDIQELMTWVTNTNTTDDAIEQIARAADYLAEVHSQIPHARYSPESCKPTIRRWFT